MDEAEARAPTTTDGWLSAPPPPRREPTPIEELLAGAAGKP